MKYILRFQSEVGSLFIYLCIALSVLAFITGWFLLITNRRYPRVAIFISTTFFLGAVSSGIGSVLHYNFISEDDILAVPMFWGVFGLSLLMGLGGGILIVWVPLLEYLGGFMIGMAGGFSMLNLFSIIVYSDVVLLACSILMGSILGWMAHVFEEPFQIVVIPCTAVLLVQFSILILIQCTCLLTSLPPIEITKIFFYTSRCCITISPLLIIGNVYYHYREYYLKRERFEMMGYSSETNDKPLTQKSTSTTKLPLTSTSSTTKLSLNSSSTTKLPHPLSQS